MDKSTKTTIILVALALASSAEAFVSPSSSTKVDTQLNALWRHWIPQNTDMMDLMMGDKSEPQQHREFVVAEPLDENDATTTTNEARKTVSLLSKAKNDVSSATELPKRGPGIWAAAAAASFLLTSVALSPAPVQAVSGGGLDFAGLDISNQDFSKGNYKGKDFTQVLARNTNFAGSNLVGCRFPKAYLINANYEGADIRGVSFEGTNMENTNLKDAVASGAYFGATIVDAANVENADFTDAQFPPKTLALMCDRPDMKGTNPTTGVDTRESAMCP